MQMTDTPKPKRNQLQVGRSVKHYIFLTFKDGQRFKLLYNEISDRLLCGSLRLPFWLSLTFASCLSLYLANSLLTTNWGLELFRNCKLNSVNTLPSGGTGVVALETWLCRSYTLFISRTDNFYTLRARFPRALGAVSRMRRTDWTFTWDRTMNELQTSEVNVS